MNLKFLCDASADQVRAVHPSTPRIRLIDLTTNDDGVRPQERSDTLYCGSAYGRRSDAVARLQLSADEKGPPSQPGSGPVVLRVPSKKWPLSHEPFDTPMGSSETWVFHRMPIMRKRASGPPSHRSNSCRRDSVQDAIPYEEFQPGESDVYRAGRAWKDRRIGDQRGGIGA
jgi:hypothetical protein